MNIGATPPQALLCALLHYDPQSGILVYKTRFPEMFAGAKFPADATCKMWNTKFSGERADRAARKGYRRVSIFNKVYSAHRVIWKMVHNAEPPEIDHINGDRGNNTLANLRETTRCQNMRNTKCPITNTSGVAGVNWYLKNKKWAAYIKSDGKKRHLGYFDKFEQAVAIRKKAEADFGFHPNHGRVA